ncbi:autoinducer binding domain-containing protein [Chitinimonas viridis]|uniref:Autoinducer binding domain-containing protein n=1 Tax=Chitinimonas viridis TaxID=664880 RepID=A0ABT8B1F9_9NEIS|nr:autoinducer binding domain-containing protein [Chitinimonas viridis]MDN3575958.1 autoinducer binding domain-containing protein [Chitinimonas viridis]
MEALRDSLGHVRLADELADQISAMASALGFRNFMLGYVNPTLSNAPFWIDRMPNRTWDAGTVVARDPVTTEVVTTTVPKTIIWTAETYASAGAADLWELGNSIGIHNGVVHAARPGGRRRMMLSMDRDAAFDGTLEQQINQAKQLAYFTDMLAGAVITLFDTQDQIEADLSKTELEALKWVFGFGYSAIEIAERLNISHLAARQLLQGATEKIGAGNYIQASMIAARYGALGAV